MKKYLSQLVHVAVKCILISTMFLATFIYAAEVSSLFNKDLPNIPGFSAEIVIVEYEPGEASASHRHDANTFVYVLEGVVEMQVEGGELKRLVAGETFYESPDDIHTVSRNASETEAAKILVFYVR